MVSGRMESKMEEESSLAKKGLKEKANGKTEKKSGGFPENAFLKDDCHSKHIS